MSMDTPAGPLAAQYSDIRWGAVIAGAIAAAAFALVLHAFALGIGFSVSSTSPTWRDASFGLVLASGFYLILVALASYSFGGYVAARARGTLATAETDAGEFSDGLHGLIVWGVATLLTGLLALGVTQATSRLAAPSGSAAAQATSVGGENLIAYDLDRLFRGAETRPQQNVTYDRAEAARILFTASSHRGLQQDDRAYLVRLVSAVTGLAPPEADRRVNEAVTSAHDNISRARRTAVVLAFMIAAAALLGAVAAWYAAVEGGRHRDGREAVPTWLDWRTHSARPW
jgi:hypothetical protein